MEGQGLTRSTPWERSFRFDAPVIALAILVLIAGWMMKITVEGERTPYLDPESGFSFEYPSSWTPIDRKGISISVHYLRAEGIHKPGFWIEAKSPSLQENLRIQALVAPLTVDRGRQLLGYRVLSVAEIELDGNKVMQIEYAYVEMPSASTVQTSVPVVVRAADTLLLDQDTLYIITYAAPEVSFPTYVAFFEEILESFEVGP
jgi:hypothetical protein